MPSLLDNVKRMQAEGVPEEQIGEFIQQYRNEELKTPERARREGYESPSRPVSTATSQVVPTGEEKMQAGKDVAAGLVRYGVPAAAGIAAPELAIPNLIKQALISGGSELAARRIERIGSDPEYDTIWSDLKAGGATGLMDFGINLATRGLGAGMRKIGEKILIPSEIPLEVRIAQETLGELPDEYIKTPGPVRKFLEWTGATKGKRPFSLTFGQLNAEEKSFIGWLEGISRAGIGSRGIMSRFNARNERALTDMIEEYVANRATKVSGPEFAQFTERIIGNLKDRGEMFEPVTAYRKYLYTQFEQGLQQSGGTIDGSALRKYFREGGNVADTLSQRIYSRLRTEGLVPPLETPSKNMRRITNVRTQKTGEQSIDQMQDVTRTDLLSGETKRKAEAVVGKKAVSSESNVQTVRETETIVGMTEQELAQEWSSLPAYDTDKIIKVINKFYVEGNDELNNSLKYLRGKIEDPFQRFIKTDQRLSDLHDAADSFFKAEVANFRNASIKGLRKAMTNNPSKVLSMIGGGEPNAKQVYDRLMDLKKALQFSNDPTGDIAAAAAGKVTASKEGRLAAVGMLRQQYNEWDRTFLQPIRYNMLTRNIDKYGRLEPNKFLDMLNSNADVPEFFSEVFGGAAQVDEVKRMMTALSIAQQTPTEKSIIIQLAQAGLLGSGISATGQAIFGDDVTVKGTAIGGAVGVLLGPYALAKMMTKPEVIRSFTDGLKQGARSGRFAMALRKVSEMKIASELVRESPSSDAFEYYTTVPGQSPQ